MRKHGKRISPPSSSIRVNIWINGYAPSLFFTEPSLSLEQRRGQEQVMNEDCCVK